MNLNHSCIIQRSLKFKQNFYDFNLKLADFPSTSNKRDLSGERIFPIILTGEAGVISPFLPIGVGPKNRHIAFHGGQ